MKKFIFKVIVKIVIFISLIILLIGGAILFNFNHKEDYPAAIKNKYERLDSLKHTQKLIICGGSSSAYGINSALIQKNFHIPVVNTSLAMSLGSNFQLNLTKDYITKNDIVLYIPEYEFYYRNENGDDFLYTTFFYYPKIVKDFNASQKINLRNKITKLSIDFYIGAIRKLFKAKKTATSLQYNRASYNYMGDNISLVYNNDSKIKPQDKTRYQGLNGMKVSGNFITAIKKMNEFCIQKGARFIIAFPPIEKSQFDTGFLKDINIVKKETNIKFMGLPSDNVYTSDFFYDSSYHLNGKGRVIRTKKLIENLKKEIE
ncbi:hypothetical protein [Polaribacter butkevichii]|uniref:Uncharacterized protein n=1 Tax=Polaribacter butkevichii TaxID=218490 RepID=A0A2P6CEH6_9FLAO|nr:hypothetical protein [Polaribacter butkevichii]PQJ73311.1 hypothetical protein BTO14_08575 [Polaribacter butkevichii]